LKTFRARKATKNQKVVQVAVTRVFGNK